MQSRVSQQQQHHRQITSTTGTVSSVGRGGMSSVGGAVTVIGGANGVTVSSIAFTPVQGIELVNNEQKRVQQQQQAGGEKYFSVTAAFSRVGTHRENEKKYRPAVPKF